MNPLIPAINPVPATYIEQFMQVLEEQTYPDWRDTRNGAPFSYKVHAVVNHKGTNWMSMRPDNDNEPGVDNTWVKWSDVLFNTLPKNYGDEYEQLWSKSEPVYIYKDVGSIKMDASEIYPEEMVMFQALGNFIDKRDCVAVTIASGSCTAFDYDLRWSVSNGCIDFFLINRGKSTLKENVVINYRIIK